MKRKSLCVVLRRTKTCSLDKGISVWFFVFYVGVANPSKSVARDFYHRFTCDGQAVPQNLTVFFLNWNYQ